MSWAETIKTLEDISILIEDHEAKVLEFIRQYIEEAEESV